MNVHTNFTALIFDLTPLRIFPVQFDKITVRFGLNLFLFSFCARAVTGYNSTNEKYEASPAFSAKSEHLRM